MKNFKYLLLFVVIISFWACKPQEFGPIVSETKNVSKQIQGVWGLTKVTQIDQDATTKGFPYKQLDITNVYPYKDLVITLQGDADGNPSNFMITQGNSPKIADINGGTWTVDNPQAPTAITLKNGAVTNVLTLGSYADLNSGKFYLKRIKSFNGKPIVSYQYEFTRK